MATLQELEEKINHLESELYETKMIAYSSFNSLKSSNCALGYRFNLLNPKTLNGKLNWLALNYWDNHPGRYYINDKLYFKYYMKRMFDENLVVPLIGVWDSAKDIDFNKLPERFVLKRTLGGAASEVVLVDMKQDNLEEIKEKAYRWSNINDNAPARIIAEELLQFDSDYIIDYKAYVFNGKVGLYMCGIMKKSGGHRSYVFYDAEWKRKNYKVSQGVMDIPKPKMLSDIVCIAEEIGKHFPFIRVDFYISKGKIYVGELTGLPFNALGPYEKDDFVLGKKLVLPTMEEIRTNYKEVFDVFPELLINPIYLKGKNPNYKIIQPNNTNSTLPELPALLF